MLIILIIAFILVYFIGLGIVANSETIQNVKFHKGGFLNLGYTTNNNRRIEKKDIIKGMIWPVDLVWSMFRGCIGIINEILGVFLLLFNSNYRDSKFYEKIDDWAWLNKPLRQKKIKQD